MGVRSLVFPFGPETIVVCGLGGGGQARSLGGVELPRGRGEASEKSAALEFVSSPDSSRVAQPAEIERMSALPSEIPLGDALGALGEGSPAEGGVKEPQETQSAGTPSG